MKMRKVGRTDLRLPALVLGAMARRQSSDKERIKLFEAAIDQGFNAIDTAPLYGFGRAEQQLGTVLKHVSRNQVQILTKVGLRWHGEKHGEVLFEFTDDNGRLRQVRKDSRPESVRLEVLQSLERLGVETLDLVQIHHPDVHTPFADTMGTLLDMRREGKLRHIGVSNFSAEQVRAAQIALGEVPLCSVQPDYSLVRKRAELELLPLCRELDIGVLVFSPLAEGLLAGKKLKVSNPAVQKIEHVIQQKLLPVARRYGVSRAAVALAWVTAQPGITSAISGASTIEQLNQQSEAIQLKLSESELQMLDAAFSKVQLPYSWETSGRRLHKLVRRGRALLGRTARRIGIDPSTLRPKL
jgi:aryl-alcohol dehydrogenase-like predicted oxidoreductase